MPFSWTLVSTTVREADGSGPILAARMSGDMIITIRSRQGANIQELWRSDDRAATWSFTTITNYTDGQFVYGISDPFQEYFWWTNIARQELCRTPVANPGAGGFTFESTVGTNGFASPQPSGSYMYGFDVGSTNLYRRTAAATYTLVAAPGASFEGMITIPDSTDLLMLRNATLDKRVLRIAPLTGTTVYNIQLGSAFDAGNRPHHFFSAITSEEIIAAMLPTSSTDPARIWRSTNSGSSYTEGTLTSGFWTGTTGVTSATQVGQGSNFIRTGGTLYGFIQYFDATNVAQHRRHVKLATFNGTSWDIYSDDTNDGGTIVDTVVGTNDSGDVDFYVSTYDETIDTTRWYRLTVAGTSADYTPDTCP